MRRRATVPALLLLIALALTGAVWLVSRPVADAAGLRQSFYSSPDLQGPPASVRQVPSVGLAWFEANASLPTLSVRWDGYWMIESAGPVDLSATSEHPLRVWVDQQLALECQPSRGIRTSVTRLQLERGPHRLQIDDATLGRRPDLDVRWAPAGQPLRALSPAALFVRTPEATVVRRARLLDRLRLFEHAVWMLGGFAAAFFWVGPPVVTSLSRLGRPRVAPIDFVPLRSRLSALVERHASAAVALSGSMLLVSTAWARWAGLNPKTLWADDVWLATLTRITPMWRAVVVPAPVPPGFVALLWLAARVIPDPEVSLQTLPFLCGLLGPIFLALLVRRLTASRALALVALSLGLASPYVARYSVFAKQYTFDYVVATVLLLMAVPVLRDGHDRFKSLAIVGAASALFSLPSMFCSVAILHVAALRVWLERSLSAPAKWARLRWVVGFDLVLAVLFVAVLRQRSGPALGQYWRADFLPVTSFRDAWEFLSDNGRSLIVDSLPRSLALAAPLALVGQLWMLLSRPLRWFGYAVLVVYAGLLGSSALHLYPIGVELRGRVDMFSYALTTLLVVLGVHAVTCSLRTRAVVNIPLAVLTAALGFIAPAEANYFALDHVDLVHELDTRAQPSDAVVFTQGGAYLAGYYARWQPDAVPNASMQGFGVAFDRPHTISLNENDSIARTSLDRFLTVERPTRLWLFSTRANTAPAESLIRARDCAEVARWSSTVKTILVQYACAR